MGSRREDDEGSASVEAPLLESQRGRGRRKNWGGEWPKSIKYIVWNEFCERFSFYGLKTILALFLVQHLRLTENSAAEYVHLFIVISYIAPLLGAILSDSVLGKYRTILYVSLIYSVGNCVLASSAFADTSSGSVSLSFSLAAAGLILIALGTGGIKPCVSAFGGDQIEYTLPDGPAKDKLQRRFFSMYYFAVNSGALISTILTPVLRTRVSYSLAFGVPAALMIVAVTIFWAGSKHYVYLPPGGNVFTKVYLVVNNAVKLRVGNKGSTGASVEAADEEDVGLRRGGGEVEESSDGNFSGHWLDAAKQTQDNTLVEDVKSLLAVIVVLLPTPLFWSLSDQQSSKWIFQGGQMNRKAPWWLGGFVIEEDQMQALNPLLVLGLIPLFDQIIYPSFEKRGIPLKLIPRMWLGIVLSAVAFLLSGLLQIAIESDVASGGPGSGIDRVAEISIFWQIPQYLVVTSGEILFSITGLEFAYSEAPDSMKSAVQAVWLFAVASGNIVTVILFAVIGDRLSKANEYFCFAILAVIAALAMIWLGSGFRHRHGAKSTREPEETPIIASSVE